MDNTIVDYSQIYIIEQTLSVAGINFYTMGLIFIFYLFI